MSILQSSLGSSGGPFVPSHSRWAVYKLGLGARTLISLPLAVLAVGMWLPLTFVFGTAFVEGSFDSAYSAIAQPLFLSALLRTLSMAVFVALICTCLGVIYAFALAICSGPVRAFLLFAIGTTFVISLMVRNYGWIILLQPRGVVGSLLTWLRLLDGPLAVLQTPVAMYIGMVHVMLPYSIVLTYSALSALDANQLRAARSMGASASLTFRHIVLPQVSGGVLAGGILVFMLSLGFYITPALLGGPTQLTIGTLIGREMSQKFDFQAAAAMGAALLAVVAGLYLIAEKLFHLSERWSQQ